MELQQPDFSLQGNVAMVTGASQGIGYGLSKMLALAGAKVAVCARKLSELENLCGEIRTGGGEARAYALDVTDIKQIGSVVASIQKDFGRLDIQVNNAGLGGNHPATEVTEADWDELMDVNLKGLFFCCQAAGRVMLAQKYGRIINMSSQAGAVGIREHAVYCATKGGVNLLTKVLALEWSARGVTVNAVAPTFIYTPGTAERLDNPDYLKGVLDRLPIGHVGNITDVAGAVIYLASPAGGMVNGTVLLVDGGWTAQ
jgi:NAD(P)-dependent dehydrogenase (short-subunit alcohol dehydrogenase family)